MPSSAQQKEFINNIGYIIQEEAKRRGYKVCSPVIAQACLESNYGVSQLASRWHNYFGLKCGSAWKGQSVNLATKEEYNSQLVNIRDNFRVYSSMEEGVKGYFDFISTKRYSNLLSAASPKMYLDYIKKDGYATDGSYVSKCMGVISRHGLERFDTEAVPTIGNPYDLTDTLLKLGSRGDSVKWLQWELNDRGYTLATDGIFGVQTEAAVKKFQKDHGLVKDGIVGAKTIDALKKLD